jgi:hypothetical protein
VKCRHSYGDFRRWLSHLGTTHSALFANARSQSTSRALMSSSSVSARMTADTSAAAASLTLLTALGSADEIAPALEGVDTSELHVRGDLLALVQVRAMLSTTLNCVLLVFGTDTCTAGMLLLWIRVM